MTTSNLQSRPLGGLIDEAYELRQRIKELDSQKKKVQDELDVLEAEVMARLDKEQTPMSRGGTAKVVVNENEVPQITDWDATLEYLKRTDQLHLIQRRLNSAAYRELLQMGEEIPGTEPFKRRTLSITKA